MKQNTSQQMPKQKNKALVIVPWVGLVLFILLAASVGYLYATKKIVLSVNDSKTSSYTVVCGSDTINKYNSAMSYQVRSEGADPTLDTTSLGELKSDIPKKSGYVDDPTCETILFWIALQDNDANAAQKSLDTIRTLHDQFKYVDSNLANSAPLSSLQLMVDNLKADTQG